MPKKKVKGKTARVLKKKSGKGEARGKKKHIARIEKRLKNLDRELTSIEKDIRLSLDSSIVDEDIGTRKLVSMDVSVSNRDKAKNLKRFYKKFVFRCMKCKENFKKEIQLKPVKKKLKCSACGKVHSIGVSPSSRYHSISIPKSLEYVSHE